jgi:hypothetical protein
MEYILLGVVFFVCLYILYSIFTPITEPFLPSNIEDTLGKLATQILTPNTWEGTGNPTRLVATTANPISPLAAVGIQNRYDTAMGDPNAGPRIDDTSSLLYMVDFCFEKGKESSPFSDSTFATNCGMCMTMGTNITGKGTSNFGIVVYPEDKEYSLKNGIDAVASAHSATCAPLVKAEGASSNVRSVAINSAQYEATKTYKQLNSYATSRGIGAGPHSLTCANDSVIKQGFWRDGAWDTQVAPIDYTRRNLLTTMALPATCIEKKTCDITSKYAQWDMSALCGNPKPTEITNLRVDDSKTTSTSLTFRWEGGLNAETYEHSLVKLPENTVVTNGSPVFNLAAKTVKYINLTPATQYKFSLILKNTEGTVQGDLTTGADSGGAASGGGGGGAGETSSQGVRGPSEGPAPLLQAPFMTSTPSLPSGGSPMTFPSGTPSPQLPSGGSPITFPSGTPSPQMPSWGWGSPTPSPQMPSGTPSPQMPSWGWGSPTPSPQMPSGTPSPQMPSWGWGSPTPSPQMPSGTPSPQMPSWGWGSPTPSPQMPSGTPITAAPSGGAASATGFDPAETAKAATGVFANSPSPTQPQGVQPTNVKFLLTNQNTYKTVHWRIPYGDIKVSFTPPQSSGVAQYVIVHDGETPATGTNTLEKSIGGFLYPSDAKEDPFNPGQVYYILRNFLYRAKKAGVLALYSPYGPSVKNIQIPLSVFVNINAHDPGPAYSGPPIQVFSDCEGNTEIKDATNNAFVPGQYIRNAINGIVENDVTRNDEYVMSWNKFNSNISYVKVPPGINVNVTYRNGLTIPLEGGPYTGGQNYSLCDNTGANDSIIAISIQNTGITPTSPTSDQSVAQWQFLQEKQTTIRSKVGEMKQNLDAAAAAAAAAAAQAAASAAAAAAAAKAARDARRPTEGRKLPATHIRYQFGSANCRERIFSALPLPDEIPSSQLGIGNWTVYGSWNVNANSQTDLQYNINYILVPEGLSVTLKNIDEVTHTVIGPNDINLCSSSDNMPNFRNKLKSIKVFQS